MTFVSCDDGAAVNLDHVCSLRVDEEADFYRVVAYTIDGDVIVVKHGVTFDQGAKLVDEIVALARVEGFAESPIDSAEPTGLRVVRGSRFGAPQVVS